MYKLIESLDDLIATHDSQSGFYCWGCGNAFSIHGTDHAVDSSGDPICPNCGYDAVTGLHEIDATTNTLFALCRKFHRKG